MSEQAIPLDQWQYERPPLYPKQEAAIFDEARFSVCEAGTKSGKTVACMAWIWEQAWMGRPGQNFWWVAPFYGQARIAYTRMKTGTPPQTRYYNDHERYFRLNNGTFIWFKSAEKSDALYGEDVYGAVIDEASRVREESWWALRSTLTATEAPCRIIGNVKGKLNWAYRLAKRAREYERNWDGEGQKEYAYHRITAWDAVKAGVISEQEVEAARQDLPEEVFNELYLAKASETGTNPFGLSAIRDCTIPTLSKMAPCVWGWDLARKKDWTVGVGLDVYGRVSKFVRFQHDWPETVRIILETTGKLPALVDSTGVGDVVVQQLERDGGNNFVGFMFTQRSKQQLMEGLALAIQRGDVYFPDGVIVDELESFEYEHTQRGVRYSAPEGMHDDCVCALALARQNLVTSSIKPAEVW